MAAIDNYARRDSSQSNIGAPDSSISTRPRHGIWLEAQTIHSPQLNDTHIMMEESFHSYTDGDEIPVLESPTYEYLAVDEVQRKDDPDTIIVETEDEDHEHAEEHEETSDEGEVSQDEDAEPPLLSWQDSISSTASTSCNSINALSLEARSVNLTKASNSRASGPYHSVSTSDNRHIQRQLVRSGWLNKKREVIKSWNRRYFVLIKRMHLRTGAVTASFQYYKGTNFTKLRGEIQLHEGTIWIRVLTSHEIKRPYCFEVSQGEYSMICQAADQQQVTEWVYHIQTVASSVFKSGIDTSVKHPTPLLDTAVRENRMFKAASFSRPAISMKRSVHKTYSSPKLTLKETESESSMECCVLPTEESISRHSKRGQHSKVDRKLRDREMRIFNFLRRIFQNSKCSEAAACRVFTKSLDTQSKPNMLKHIREFHLQMIETVLEQYGDQLGKVAANETVTELASNSQQIRKVASDIGQMRDDKDTFRTVRRCVAMYLEQVICIPILDPLYAYLRKEFQEEDVLLNRKLRWLQGKDQTHFHIPYGHQSDNKWRRACQVLARITSYRLPNLKYQVLANTLSEIRCSFEEKQSAIPEFDDVLPILTFVITHSGIDNLLSLRALFMELSGCHTADIKSSEDSSVMTLFSAAVENIKTVCIPAALEDIFRDPITVSIDSNWSRYFDFEPEPTYRYGAVIHEVTMHGMTAFGLTVTHGHVLVLVNGQNVVLWPYQDIISFLQANNPPYRLAFISSLDYAKILTTNKSLWNVALMYACQRGDISSVQMLLANGAEINYIAHECGGNTPLHVAVSALHFNVVSYLLQHGARVNAIGEYKRSALHMLGAPCMMPCSLWLHTFDSLLLETEKVILIIRKLLYHGAELHRLDLYGNNILMLLADTGCLGGIDVVMDRDTMFPLNARNWVHGMSALSLAAKKGYYEVVEALLDYGASVDLFSLHGETALHFAASTASSEICTLLLNRGANVNAQTKDGITPLMLAVAVDHCTELLEQYHFRDQRLLLPCLNSSSSATKNIQFHNTIAAKDTTNVSETIEILSNSQGTMEFVCRRFCIALHYAAKYQNTFAYELLLSKMKRTEEIEKDALQWSQMPDISSQTPQILLEIPQPIQRNDSLLYDHRDGVFELIGGTMEALVTAFLHSEIFPNDMLALVRFCDDHNQFLDFFRVLESGLQDTQALDAQTPPIPLLRTLLYVLDMIIQCMQYKQIIDYKVCEIVCRLMSQIFASLHVRDVQCMQWLECYSILPSFLDACRSGHFHAFRRQFSCDSEYKDLKTLLQQIKYTDTSIPFLYEEEESEDVNKAIATKEYASMEISERMRHRLSVAGVYTERISAKKNAFDTSISVSMHELKRLEILEIDAMIFAQQLTLLQHLFFSNIRLSEFFAYKRNATETPAFDRLRKLHNHITDWIVSRILTYEEPEQRAQLLAFFINVAAICLSPLQNLDGFMAIMNATNHSSIFRLQKTWGRLPSRELWHELKKHTENAARTLNKAMREACPPCVPYIGVIIQNIVLLHEFPDFYEGATINLKKSRQQQDILSMLQRFQRVPYLFPIDKRVFESLCSKATFADQDSAFQRSLLLEPRVTKRA